MLTDRQMEIVEKSIEIIDNKGIQGLTIKHLSKEIGITESALYRHFESKNDIILAILDGFNEISEMLAGMMKTFEGTTIEKINTMFGNMLDLFSETPSVVSVIFSEELFKNDKVLKQHVKEIQNRNQNTVEMILNKGQEQGDVRKDVDSKYLALIIMGGIRLMVKNWSLNDYDFDINDEGDKLMKTIGVLISN